MLLRNYYFLILLFVVEPKLEIRSLDTYKVEVKIVCPKRLVKYPKKWEKYHDKKKFELTHVMAILESEIKVEVLCKERVEFGSSPEWNLELPPRMRSSTGDVVESLKAVACYGDGRKEFSAQKRIELPTYSKDVFVNCCRSNLAIFGT